MAKTSTLSTGKKEILIALIGLAATITTGIFSYLQGSNQGKDEGQKAHSVPPNINVTQVDRFPSDTGSSSFTLLRDISIFDLRAWKPIDLSDKKKERIQPCHYINYLHLIKTKQNDKFIAHYGTSGYGIDLRCISSDYKILKREEPARHPTDEAFIEYQVEIDVSSFPLNKEFLLVVEGTYWNGFSNLTSESVSTYTDDDISDLQELALIVFFPFNKPLINFEVLTSSDNGVDKPYRGPSNSLYADRNNRFIYWNIAEKEQKKHYKIKWQW